MGLFTNWLLLIEETVGDEVDGLARLRVLTEIGEHLDNLLVEGIPLVAGVQRRQEGIGITFVIDVLETVEAGDGGTLQTQSVNEPEGADGGIVKMSPSSLDYIIETDDELTLIGFVLDV
jgi:hypothetical protein